MSDIGYPILGNSITSSTGISVEQMLRDSLNSLQKINRRLEAEHKGAQQALSSQLRHTQFLQSVLDQIDPQVVAAAKAKVRMELR